jgi:holo-[acyl-carrier protein] synthase|tara:strand:- start:76 stop:432 length:357 start_codon:yes stop_codon:yes gene_type:complete
MLKNFGIGIDIVEIKRFQEKPFEKNVNFYKKIFTDSEIKYCLTKKNFTEEFALKFAIKEAVIKSIKKQIELFNIITDYEYSNPIVSLKNDKTYKFLVSCTHEKLFVIAAIVSEKQISS